MSILLEYFRPPKITVQDMYIFPVKSCKGIKVQSARYTEEGFEFDRLWMFVDRGTHKLLNAVMKTKMILIETDIDLTTSTLVMTLPGVTEPLRFPINIPDDVYDDPTRTFQDFNVWGSINEGVSCGTEEQNTILSRYLGIDVLLIRKGRLRRVAGPLNFVADLPGLSLNYGDKYDVYGDEKTQAVVSWANEMPMHIVSQKSMDEINRRMHEKSQGYIQGSHLDNLQSNEKDTSIIRFRPNIVVNGNRLEPWVEDSWSHVTVGNSELYIVQRCARCSLPRIDPETALFTRTPDAYMKQDRYVWHLGKRLCFGMSVVPKTTEGIIHVGDELRVLGSYTKRDRRGNWVRPEDPPEEEYE